MDKEILDFIRTKGLLLEKSVFDLVDRFEDKSLALNFLTQLERLSGQKIFTKTLLDRNFEYVRKFVGNLDGNSRYVVEKIFVNFGFSFEVIRERKEILKREKDLNYKIFYADTVPYKKLEVKDFAGYFRSRFQQMQKILLSRAEMSNNLVSINKISSDRTTLNIIAMVREKRVTKNKNMILVLEDLTGQINALVKFDKEDLFSQAEELQLDDIIGIRASGNRDMIFIYDLFFPDAFIHEKVKFDNDVSVAFLSDIHCGSDRHLKESLGGFLDWINSDDEAAKKIKYLFFVGDNVDGVGVFPGQERVLELKSMKEQYKLLASYLRRVPENITMFMCPGQHDATRVAEPQPLIDRRYAPELYEMENLILVTNPALIKLFEGDREFKVLMYHGASIHTFINEIKSLRVMKAHKSPAKAVRHMLKRRHLSPSHSEAAYIPNADHDPLLISEVPDVLCTGEVHRIDIENYNGVLIITGSCWQARTPFEEKVGNIPDPAKVPVLNLKTRELKIYDFGVEEELNKKY